MDGMEAGNWFKIVHFVKRTLKGTDPRRVRGLKYSIQPSAMAAVAARESVRAVRAVGAMGLHSAKTAVCGSSSAATWMKGRSAGWLAGAPASFARGQSRTERRCMFTTSGAQHAAGTGAEQTGSMLPHFQLSGAVAGNVGDDPGLLQRSMAGHAVAVSVPGLVAGACLPRELSFADWQEELPLLILPDSSWEGENETVVYEAMNRNNRKPKAANHGKRPCSRWRRRRKTCTLQNE
jgi:hypothetical protein